MRLVGVVLLALTIACQTVTIEGPTVLSTESEGFVFGLLTCEQNRVVEYEQSDFPEAARGFETISDAIDDFRNHEEWQRREDWHSLTPGDMATSPVELTDERGWVALVVRLVRWNDTWLVSGFESCALPDS